jgi:hypothetical protein
VRSCDSPRRRRLKLAPESSHHAGSGRRDSNPRHLAWEAVPWVTTVDDERLRSPTAMGFAALASPVDPHGYVPTFPDVCGMNVARQRRDLARGEVVNFEDLRFGRELDPDVGQDRH